VPQKKREIVNSLGSMVSIRVKNQDIYQKYTLAKVDYFQCSWDFACEKLDIFPDDRDGSLFI
jgi:hypothetical protein